MMVPVLSGKRAFGTLLARDLVLNRAEHFSPFGISFRNGVFRRVEGLIFLGLASCRYAYGQQDGPTVTGCLKK